VRYRRPVKTGGQFSGLYLLGWMPLVALLLLPVVSFTGIPAYQIAAVLALVCAGYITVKWTEKSTPAKFISAPATPVPAAHYLRAILIFSTLSIIGCQLVLREQATTFGDASFENLQERYVALIEASLNGTATSSIWSTIGNLIRALFFVALTAYVSFTKHETSRWKKLAATAVIAFTLFENFQVNVSRLQFVFYIVLMVVVAVRIDHPLLKKKWPIIIVGSALFIFLAYTATQRFDATFGDRQVAADYIANLFGVEVLTPGRWLIEYLGLGVFSVLMYLAQGIPEVIRLITNNNSPYALGTHSLFLVVSPLMRLIGMPLAPNSVEISNQGLWWGFLGDLYLDFGVLFPIMFLVILHVMVRVAARFGTGPIYGMTLRCLTGGMLLIVPYTGIFNTYSVSYFCILMLAIGERHKASSRRRSRRAASHPIRARSPTSPALE